MRNSTRQAAVLLLAASAAVAIQAQTQAPARRPGAATAAEAIVLTNGWASLAEHDLAAAESRARQALLVAPRSVGARALLLEVGIARGGVQGGMQVYEELRGGRQEDPAGLRRLAQALLYDTAFGPESMYSSDALRVLAELGDDKANRYLDEAVRTGGLADVRMAAALGNPAAVERLAAASMRQLPGLPLALEALGKSRNPAALPAIRARLQDPMSEVRGAAAEALGRVGGQAAAGELVALLADPSLHVRLKAASGLYAIGHSGGDALLNELATSPLPDNQLAVALAWAERPEDGRWQTLARQLLDSDNPDVQLGAARLAIRLDPQMAMEAINDLAARGDGALAKEAVRLRISTLGGELGPLRQYLVHQDPFLAIESGRMILSDLR
jgi:hypothetical protein